MLFGSVANDRAYGARSRYTVRRTAATGRRDRQHIAPPIFVTPDFQRLMPGSSLRMSRSSNFRCHARRRSPVRVQCVGGTPAPTSWINRDWVGVAQPPAAVDHRSGVPFPGYRAEQSKIEIRIRLAGNIEEAALPP